MQKTKVSISPRQIFILFLMGFAYSIIYATPFIQYVFYDDLASALNATNTQLGVLIAIFGVGNLIAPIGGVISDKFNAKTVYLIGMYATCLLSFIFAMNMNYKFAVFIWSALAVAALFLFFPAHTKLVRLLGDEKSQGTLFGTADALYGLASVVINFIALAVYAKFAIKAFGGGIGGLRAVIISYGVVGLIVTTVLIFLLPNPDKVLRSAAAEEGKTKISRAEWIGVFKDPRTWLSGITVFSCYSVGLAVTYFTPYMTNVLGITVVSSGVIAVIRTYGIRVIGAPLGGFLGDKINSVSRVIGITLGLGGIVTVIFMTMTGHASAGAVTAITLLIGFLIQISRGGMMSIPSEMKIPRKYAATAAGIVCAVGFCPDLFLYTLYGHWLDTYGNAGYTRIFIYTICMMVLGVVNSIVIHFYKKKYVETGRVEIEGGNDEIEKISQI